jgi:hypothetical protein
VNFAATNFVSLDKIQISIRLNYENTNICKKLLCIFNASLEHTVLANTKWVIINYQACAKLASENAKRILQIFAFSDFK